MRAISRRLVGAQFAVAAVAAVMTLSPRCNASTTPVDLLESSNYPYGTSVQFSPAQVTINVGDTVRWAWESGSHSVTSGTPDQPSGLFDSGIHQTGYTFSHTFTEAGEIPYYCRVHGSMMTGSVKVVSPPPPAALVNLSTRMRVETGERVLIAGFIISGNAPKRLALRGLGPSLTVNGAPVAGALPNPFLELHDGAGTVLRSNDDWAAGPDAQELTNDHLAPADSHEAALLSSLAPGGYTALLRDANGGSGIGLVELYDMDQTAPSAAVNISTRGSVQQGDDVMIGGLIIGGSNAQRAIVRALGPSLTSAGIANALADPKLELHDGSGTIIASNDNWRSDHEAEIMATGVEPKNDLEAAIVYSFAPGAYTAMVAGVNGSTGIGLIEAYQLSP